MCMCSTISDGSRSSLKQVASTARPTPPSLLLQDSPSPAGLQQLTPHVHSTSGLLCPLLVHMHAFALTTGINALAGARAATLLRTLVSLRP